MILSQDSQLTTHKLSVTEFQDVTASLLNDRFISFFNHKKKRFISFNGLTCTSMGEIKKIDF